MALIFFSPGLAFAKYTFDVYECLKPVPVTDLIENIRHKAPHNAIDWRSVLEGRIQPYTRMVLIHGLTTDQNEQLGKILYLRGSKYRLYGLKPILSPQTASDSSKSISRLAARYKMYSVDEIKQPRILPRFDAILHEHAVIFVQNENAVMISDDAAALALCARVHRYSSPNWKVELPRGVSDHSLDLHNMSGFLFRFMQDPDFHALVTCDDLLS